MDIIKAIGDNKMKKIIAILLVLIMISMPLFAEGKEAEKNETTNETIEFSLSQKKELDRAALAVFFTAALVVSGIVMHEIIIDGAYGTRD